jgi:hypothetical protein
MSTMSPEQLALRNAFLKEEKPKFILVEHNGVTLEVRQPTLGERNRVQQSSKVELDAEDIEALADSGNKKKAKKKIRFDFDYGRLQINAVIAYTYFPQTDVKVFNEVDVPTLESARAGGGIDKLLEAAMQMQNVKQEIIAKKSETTLSAASSTSSH